MQYFHALFSAIYHIFFITFLTTTTLVYGSMLWILFGFALVAYLSSIIFRKVFVKYEPKEEEEEGLPDNYQLPDETAEKEESLLK